MITMYSDYNPEAAANQLENECAEMLRAALYIAGIDDAGVDGYFDLSDASAAAYENALAIAVMEGLDVQSQYDSAVMASKEYQKTMTAILSDAGITIVNDLHKSDDSSQHSTIQTTIYSNDDAMVRIIRPIADIEANTYVDNSTGFNAHKHCKLQSDTEKAD